MPTATATFPFLAGPPAALGARLIGAGYPRVAAALEDAVAAGALDAADSDALVAEAAALIAEDFEPPTVGGRVV